MRTIFLTILCCCFLQVTAQEFVGLSYGNYSGIHAAYRNPASLAAAPLSFQLNISAVDVHALNNYLFFDSPSSTFELLRSGMAVKKDHFVEKMNGRPKLFSTGFEYRGPGVMISSRKLGFALSTRRRMLIQGNNITEQVARMLWHRTEAPDLYNVPRQNQSVSLSSNMMSEAAVSFAAVLLENHRHILKGGASIKRLWGLYSSNIDISNISYEIKKGASGNTYMDIEQLDMAYSYTKTNYSLGENSWEDLLLLRNVAGRGWGWDVGFTYEYHKKPKRYQLIQKIYPYKLRLGLSLQDMGSVLYKGHEHIRHSRFSRKNLIVDPGEILASKPSTLDTLLTDLFAIQPSEKLDSYRAYLPASLTLNLDAHLSGPLFLNMAWQTNVRSHQAAGLQQNSLLSFTPRLEKKAVEMAVPFIYYPLLRQFFVGSFLRLGPFFIGSDQLSELLRMGHSYGADLYMGVSLYGFRKKAKPKGCFYGEGLEPR